MNNKELITKLNARIKIIETQLTEAKDELSKAEEPVKVIGRHRPAEGYEHWFISDYGEIHRSTKQGELERHLSLGNSYETKEEAELAREFKTLCVPTEPMPTGEHWWVYADGGTQFCLLPGDRIRLSDRLIYKLGILGTDEERLQKLCDFLNEHPECIQWAN